MDIANGCPDILPLATLVKTGDNFKSQFDKALKFCQLSEFFKSRKQYAYTSHSPHHICQYDIRENAALLASAINRILKSGFVETPDPHGIVEKHCCDL